jgi:hypothetical protein
MPSVEYDFPPGHPARFDYKPDSPEAIEWARVNVHLRGERDWPVDHPKAVDTPGNLNHIAVRSGVDPLNPHMEEFTGRTPAQAAAVRALSLEQAQHAKESPALEPIQSDVANAALAAERKRLGVETLTQEQTSAVLAALQSAPHQPDGTQ